MYRFRITVMLLLFGVVAITQSISQSQDATTAPGQAQQAGSNAADQTKGVASDVATGANDAAKGATGAVKKGAEKTKEGIDSAYGATKDVVTGSSTETSPS